VVDRLSAVKILLFKGPIDQAIQHATHFFSGSQLQPSCCVPWRDVEVESGEDGQQSLDSLSGVAAFLDWADVGPVKLVDQPRCKIDESEELV
jgi:hypothetical protein